MAPVATNHLFDTGEGCLSGRYVVFLEFCWQYVISAFVEIHNEEDA